MEDSPTPVEWVAAQPWSDGKVGMTGASALGIATNLAAAAAPPHLAAAYVVVAPHSLFYEGRFIGGIFKEADTGNWMRGQGVADAEVVAYRKRVLLDRALGIAPTFPSTSTTCASRSSTSAAGTTSSRRATSTTSAICRSGGARARAGDRSS